MGTNYVEFRLEDLRFIHTCKICKEKRLVSEKSVRYDLTDCLCGGTTKSTGKITIAGTDNKVINDIRYIGEDYIKMYRDDIEIDVDKLKTYNGRFIWACRETGGCDLILLDMPHKRKEHEGASVFGALNNERFFYYGTYLREVSREEAKIIWRAECY